VKSGRKPIPVSEARSWRRCGLTWREISERMAMRCGRKYQPDAIWRAVRRADEANSE
jgi:hypothetical protein